MVLLFGDGLLDLEGRLALLPRLQEEVHAGGSCGEQGQGDDSLLVVDGFGVGDDLGDVGGVHYLFPFVGSHYTRSNFCDLQRPRVVIPEGKTRLTVSSQRSREVKRHESIRLPTD